MADVTLCQRKLQDKSKSRKNQISNVCEIFFILKKKKKKGLDSQFAQFYCVQYV